MIKTNSVKIWTIYTSIAIILLFVAAHKLEIGIFAPKRPSSIPSNAILDRGTTTSLRIPARLVAWL
jgi:hypothetical protein